MNQPVAAVAASTAAKIYLLSCGGLQETKSEDSLAHVASWLILFVMLRKSATGPCRICRTVPSIKAHPGRLSEPLWVHEIKHDGCRLQVRQDGSRVRC
jgi:hypothetical protein